MSTINLLPSYPAPSWPELKRVLDALVGVSSDFQIDMVDGEFVPHTSWPFTETGIAEALEQLSLYRDQYVLEFDCMVLQPEQYLDRLVAAGAKRVIVHYGSTSAYEDIKAHSSEHGYALGLAVTLDVPLAEIITHLQYVSYVQVMGIAKVGQQGQPFDERTLTRIQELKEFHPDLPVAVDGGVNATTIPALVKAGADQLAPGSAITKEADPLAAYKQLQALLTS